ncbi:hypothetical protein [Actimicrobium antarcticum]|uniref:Uncharacterized protein n=1 Tax=Actimicrobium antarcticum TaxID=1051899 RepID=A0ABP7SZD7_9BURK
MKLNFSTSNFDWISAEQWQDDIFWNGIFIAFSEDLKVFGCRKEDAIAIICSSYRYGIAYEIYGISNDIAGVPLGYFPEEALFKGPGKCIDKQWLCSNWDSHFGVLLPKLEHIWFSVGTGF